MNILNKSATIMSDLSARSTTLLKKRLRASTNFHSPKNASSAADQICRFGKNTDGNFAIMFGITSLIMFVMTGLAVDYSRYNMVYGDLVEAMDSAGLAIANYQALNEDVSTAELKAFGEQFFNENFKYRSLVDNFDIDFQITNTTITPSVTGKLDTLILDSFNVGLASFKFNGFDLSTDTEITKKGSGRIELALVLDVTGSMGDPATNSSSQSKIEDLKVSVDVMLNALYGDAASDDFIKIGVVPFNQFVNVGRDNLTDNEDWFDVDAEAYYHGARFIHSVVATDRDTSTNSIEANQADNAYNGYTGGLPLMLDPTTKVNHFDLYASSSELEWEGCVEARPYPLDELDIEPGASVSIGTLNAAMATPAGVDVSTDAGEETKDAFSDAPDFSLSSSDLADSVNTKFVPLFMPDGIDCYYGSGSQCFSTSQVPSIGYVWNTETDLGFNLASTFRNYYYDNPEDTSLNGITHDEYHYSFFSYVSDSSYATTGAGTDFAFYNDYSISFRRARQYGDGGVDYWKNAQDGFDRVFAFDYGDEEFIARTAYVGVYDPATNTYKGKYDNNSGINVSGSADPNSSCPDELLPLTTNRSGIETMIDGLTANGGTNTAIGTMWGWRLLSPEEPFTDGVAYDDGQWQKAIVIMTDGANSVGDLYTHYKSQLSGYGYAREERMGDGVDTASDMEEEIDAKMLRICQRMKDEGILVYTIMFGLDDDDTKDLFQACASEPEAPYFHDATAGTDLEEAFGDIAADLVDLHISR